MSGWWVVGSVGEAAFFGVLFLCGIVTLTIVVSWQVFWPESNTVRPGSGFWLMLFSSICFIVVGLTAFILQVSQTLASPERRSAIASRVKSEHQRRSDSTPAHANLPKLDELTDSPGVRLTYRLAGQRGENNQLILSALFASCWNTVVAILAAIVFFRWYAGEGPSYFLAALLVAFLVVSFFATRWFFRLFRVRTGIGPTAVEINALPLYPGYEYTLYVCQYGRVVFSDYRVELVAFEETTYQQGTDVRTEVVEVSKLPLQAKLYSQSNIPSRPHEDILSSITGVDELECDEEELRFQAESEKPMELVCKFRLPADIMHSFHSAHNAVVWRVGCPRREFKVARVLPKIPSSRLSPKRRLTRTEPALGLRFLGLQPRFEPKELLEFEFRVQRVAAEEVDRLELSVMWYTEGKGTEDFGVHLFETLSDDQLAPLVDGNPHPVVTTLPLGPFSYDGRLIRIRWCVRLRLYLRDGREFSAEKPFCLGHLTVEV